MSTVAASSSRGVWEAGARAGYAVSGVLHVLIGVLAVQLAVGDGSGSADQSGAFAQVASTPFGAVALWVAVVAFAALGAWQAAAALSGVVGEAADRAKAAGKAVVYLALAVTALTFARGGGSGGGQTSDATATLLQAPAGRLLVGAVGVGVLAVGAYHVHKGVTKRFLDDLQRLPAGRPGRAARWSGVVGYVAKGVALGVLGVLFVLAAVHADPSEATGLDGALRTLREAPAGPFLLLLVALGLIAYGLYSFVRARFGRL
ncbi:DUF1206 domain-containing protein [Cellulomonas shaoxiangyii]|uniref:DUF1206 domain-containing protein n=1 Tax=Cellulomonas shaoxiangyii TaxID=2566013 RepID=A0A4P7SHA4_9CELL|nr:DUF1206 domain-containing protein [Cellulomonas shaoxiangyii]QCB93340.1 DUF1206 domain-containing protein [Cellulomonas shaoxiangyii]TGY85302.1 DUF1206 domain-containing protein [Cellulomonas shaoxiangyii]